MRLAFRALLIATGLAVMVATSPAPTPFTFSTFVPAGGAQTVAFSVKSKDGKKQVRPLLHVRPWKSDAAATGVRLVGIVSLTQPPPEAYPRLDPKDSFMVGQQLEGLGTVAFVQQLPSPSEPGNLGTDPLPLPEYEDLYLTVFSPDQALEVTLDLAVQQMEEQCQCKVAETYPDISYRYDPAPPDAGTGGRDGGTDGGH
jgi:hypothetical protein